MINPFGELIGWRLLAREQGSSLYELDVAPQHLNPNGVLHGGVIFALADNGMGAALTSLLDEHEQCASITVNITFLKAVTAGTLVCATHTVQKGRSVAFLESVIRSGDRVVARAQGTFSIHRARSDGAGMPKSVLLDTERNA
jgi:acyl-CoA thioesterase